jgi:hypothetical protein
LPPWYRARVQSITEGQVQAAQIDTTAATCHAYLPADTGEGVQAGADADIASEASGGDPSLGRRRSVVHLVRKQVGKRQLLTPTTRKPVTLFKEGFWSTEFDTRALHEIVFRAAQTLQVILFE